MDIKIEKKGNVKFLYNNIIGYCLIIIVCIFLLFSVLVNILRSPLSFIASFLFTSNLVLLYLDDFELSNVKSIKYLQIISFIILLFMFVFITFNTINVTDLICNAKDESDINLHGHVNVTKDAAKELSKGMSTIGSQVGLGATMAGIGTAAGKAIAKSSIPPVQKVGLVLGASMMAGLFHSKISNINRKSVIEDHVNNNIANNDITKSIASYVNKFVNDVTQSSPLEDLLWNLEMTDYTCMSLVVILTIQVLFKFYFLDKIKLSLSSILGIKINTQLEFYLNKIINLNKKMNVVWIWFNFIILIFGLSSSAYAIKDMSVNIKGYINVHNWLNSNSHNNTSITSNSIENMLYYLEIVNYLCLVIIIFLIIQTVFKLYVKNNIKLNLSWMFGININSYLEYFLK